MRAPWVESFSVALDRLAEALREPESSIVRDACIQRFEFSFELAWKSIQAALRREGRDCMSPRACFREAFRMGWIEDEPSWVAVLEDRNLTLHTYDEQLARAVYGRLAGHQQLLQSLLGHLAKAASEPDTAH